MDDREVSSEQEYFDGVRADGRKPIFQSRKLYTGATKHYSDEPADFPFENRDPREISADELRYHVKRQELDDLDYIRESAYELIEIGRAAARRGEGTVPEVRDCPRPSDSPQAPEVDASADADAAPDAAPSPASTTGTRPTPACGVGHTGSADSNCGDSPRSGMREPEIREPRLRLVNRESDVQIPNPAVKAKDQPPDHGGAVANAVLNQSHKRRPIDPAKFAHIKPGVGLAMAERGCKLLLAVSPVRAEVARELIDMSMGLETKHSFMWDRAHAVIYATLLHMDEHFQELGFGSWMPFRFPDQWLSFCGIMTRVLAANGLIHSKYADVYRKLLDETPPVNFEGTIDERIKESRTPHNIAQCKWNQGAYTMSELKHRLQSEVWDPHDRYEELWNEHWREQLIKPKPPPN
jgi:hypothetical protein